MTRGEELSGHLVACLVRRSVGWLAGWLGLDLGGDGHFEMAMGINDDDAQDTTFLVFTNAADICSTVTDVRFRVTPLPGVGRSECRL